MSAKRLSAAVILGGCLTLTLAVQAGQTPQSKPSIVGVWRMSEMTLMDPDARKITSPQPALRIFTQRHYSDTQVASDKPRPELASESKATDKELVEIWRPFRARAGTYEIKNNEVVFKPIVAKNPRVMSTSAAPIVMTFSIEGDTLTLTTKSSSAGPVTNPSTSKWKRVE